MGIRRPVNNKKPEGYKKHTWMAYNGRIQSHAKCVICNLIRTNIGGTTGGFNYSLGGKVFEELPSCTK